MQPSSHTQTGLETHNRESSVVRDQETQDSELFKEIKQGTKKVYLCTYPDCGKIFKYKSETARHSFIHQEDRPHCCPYTDCKKSFKRADALKNHLQIHEGVLPHLCDVPGCGLRFATRAAIRYHKIKHENKRSYKCDYPGCTKAFLTPSQLKQHQNASNVHIRCSANKLQQEEPIDIDLSPPKKSSEDFSEIEPKMVEIMQWETKTVNPEGGIIDGSTAEKFEALYAYLMKENKILRDKMQEREKLVHMYKEKQTFDFEFNDEPLSLLSPQPKEMNMFLNDDEMRFLEFLKGQENNNL